MRRHFQVIRTSVLLGVGGCDVKLWNEAPARKWQRPCCCQGDVGKCCELSEVLRVLGADQNWAGSS